MILANALKAIRGMHDILPDDTPYWQNIEQTIKQVLMQYSYQEIRLPLVESTVLFQRSIGDVTDIIEKEMYTFADRNGDDVSLRPEGTAGCVRAGIENGLLYNQIQRLWYIGPMFRYERPQKGRYRQFHQLGAEVFGLRGPDIDAEVILLVRRMLETLGLLDSVTLQLNTLGTVKSRHQYQAALVAYLADFKQDLDVESQRRLTINPLRILDSKVESTQAIVANAPQLIDFVDDETKQHYQGLKSLLDSVGVAYVENPRLVRGMDYYTHTVFEWVTTHLGTQGTVCAGGRYDGLVELLGGKATPAIGFAMGLERLVLLLKEQPDKQVFEPVDIYFIALGESATQIACGIAEHLRDEMPALKLMVHHGGGSLKSQMKKADNSRAHWALILGDDEVTNNTVILKPLRERQAQTVVQQSALITTVEDLVKMH